MTADPHCSRCCPTNPVPEERDASLSSGVYEVTAVSEGSDLQPGDRVLVEPPAPPRKARASSYAVWAAGQPDEESSMGRKRAIAEAVGYTAEVQPPNEKPRIEYITDRFGQQARARVLAVVDREAAAARAAGYADGYDRAIKVARAAVRAARAGDPSTYNVWSRVASALDAAELKAPPLQPTTDDGAPGGGTITIPRPRITTGPQEMTYDAATAQYLRDAAIRVRSQRYWGSGVTACVADLLDNAADALDPDDGEG